VRHGEAFLPLITPQARVTLSWGWEEVRAMEARACCDTRYGLTFCEEICLWIKEDADEEEDSSSFLYLPEAFIGP
jgi:hypothetical protein